MSGTQWIQNLSQFQVLISEVFSELGMDEKLYAKYKALKAEKAFEKFSAFVRANDGFHSSLAWTEPFAVTSVNTLPLGVVMLKFFFDSIP